MRSIRYALLTLRNIICKTDLTALRFVLALCSLTWGLLVAFTQTHLLPIQIVTMDTTIMLLWGASFILHGATSLYSILLHKCTWMCRVLGTALGSIVWTGSTTAMTVAFVNLGSFPPALVVYVIISLSNWWILIRANTNGY